MNEFSVLMYMLSRAVSSEDPLLSKEIGASEEELCTALNYTGKNAHVQLQSLLASLAESVAVFGLVVRQNPFTQHWFITSRSEIQERCGANPFLGKKRLAATLCTILLLVLSQGGSTTIQKIQEARKKKDIEDDLQDLIALEFITRDGSTINIHPNLGYYFDINQLLLFLENNPTFHASSPPPSSCDLPSPASTQTTPPAAPTVPTPPTAPTVPTNPNPPSPDDIPK